MPMYRSWPVVPRPFDDEAFGSWFGRIAARYRIRVDELASAAGVSLDHEGLWLGGRPPQGPTLPSAATPGHVVPTSGQGDRRDGATNPGGLAPLLVLLPVPGPESAGRLVAVLAGRLACAGRRYLQYPSGRRLVD